MVIAALILAGGRGSRLGAAVPKPLVRLGHRTLLAHVLDAVPPEVSPVFLNAKENDGFEAFGLPVIPDVRPGFQGPLAGIEAAALSDRLKKTGAGHLLVLPGDTPFLTREALCPLLAAPGPLPRVARQGGRLQPAVVLWPMEALAGLTAFLDTSETYAVRAYLDHTGFEAVEIPGEDPFFNVNTPADLEAAERRLSSG